MTRNEAVAAAIQTLQTENDRLRTEIRQQKHVLAEVPRTLMDLARLVSELHGLVPLLQAWMETAQVRRQVQEYTVPGPEDQGYGYGAPPPAPWWGPSPVPPGPANAPPEAADPRWVPGQGIAEVPAPPPGETGVSWPEEMGPGEETER